MNPEREKTDEVSVRTAPVYCLERVSRLQCREGTHTSLDPLSWEPRETKAARVHQSRQHSKEKTAQKEKSEDLQRVPLRYSGEFAQCVRKLHETRKRTTRKD